MKYCYIGCKSILNSPQGLDIILNYPDNFNFDLIISDFTCGPCFLPLMHKFNYPSLIGVTPFNNPSSTVNLIGGHKFPSYVPHYVNNSPQIMSFKQRMYNNILYWIEKLWVAFNSKFILFVTQEFAISYINLIFQSD